MTSIEKKSSVPRVSIRAFVQFRSPARVACVICALVWAFSPSEFFAQTSQRKAKPSQLDADVSLKRDPSSGDLHLVEKHASPASPAAKEAGTAHALRVRVNLVPVNCNVFAPDGTSVAGLGRDDFRIYQDRFEQRVAYFDAGNDPASVALIIDASPSVVPEAAAMEGVAKSLAEILAPRDDVAVVEFSAHSYVLLPFSRDRDQLVEAISRVDVRGLFGDTGGSNIYETVYLTAAKLFHGRTGRKAILLLTDGEDSGLGLSLDRTIAAPTSSETPTKLTFDDVVRALSADGVEAYIVSTQNRPHIMTDEWLAAHGNETLLSEAVREKGIPAYTLFLAELVRRAGGGLYFLRETQSGRDAFARIAGNIRTQYTLGFYPAGEVAARPGWHSMRVEVVRHDGGGPVRAVSRSAYYVSAPSSQ